MRILLLAPSLPDPADRSPSSYTLHALQHLARDHDVTLLAGRRGPVDLAVVRALRRVCARVETAPLGESLPQGVATLAASITAGRLRAVGREGGGAFREVLDRLLRTERFDLIHCEGLAAAQMIPAFWAGPIVLDERGASWRPRLRQAEAQFGAARRWTRGRDARTLHEGEIAACRRAAVTLVRCAADRALLEDAIGTSWSVHVVPIGVDVAAWEPVWFRRDPQPGRVLTAMDRGDAGEQEGAAWLVRHVFPLLRRDLPTARFDVVGPRFSRELRLLALDAGDVTLHETARAGACWERAALFVAPPVFDGQTHATLLQALAAGVPVVAQSISAEGLEPAHDQHLLLADTPEGMADAALRLAADPALAQRLVVEGRALARDRYDLSFAHANLSAAYRHIQVGVARCVLCS